MNFKLLEAARNLKPAVKSTAIQSSPMCIHSILRQQRERKEPPFDSLLHNSLSLQNLTWFQRTLKEEISLDKEQAFGAWQTLQHLG